MRVDRIEFSNEKAWLILSSIFRSSCPHALPSSHYLEITEYNLFNSNKSNSITKIHPGRILLNVFFIFSKSLFSERILKT